MVLPKWAESDMPFAFLTSLEQALTFNEEWRTNWAKVLPLQLSGTAKAAYDADIAPEERDDYE